MQRQSHLLRPEQRPQRSEWRRCYRLPSDTRLPKPRESRSTPARQTSISLKEMCNKKIYIRVCVFAELTAVCAVMCVHPKTLAPANGFSPPAPFLRTISAGISEHLGSDRVAFVLGDMQSDYFSKCSEIQFSCLY